MKQLNLMLLITILFISQYTFSQSKPEIKESMSQMSKGNYNAFIVEVPQNQLSDLEKSWINYLKSKEKIKLTKDKGEYMAANVIVRRIGDEPLQLYSRFQQTITGTNISLFVEKDSQFISQENNPELTNQIKLFLFDFYKVAYAEAVEKELTLEKKKLKDFEKELENLHKSEDKIIQNIDKEKREIEKAENNIKVKKSEEDLKQKEIMMQKEKMLGVSLNSEEKKLQNKQIKSLENEKKKLIKTQDNERKSIKKRESTIKKSEREWADIKNKINTQTSSIGQQKEIVIKVEQKLQKIQTL